MINTTQEKIYNEYLRALGHIKGRGYRQRKNFDKIDDKTSMVLYRLESFFLSYPNVDPFKFFLASMKYKNWKLDVVCNYSVGNDIYNYYRQTLESGSNFYNQTTAMKNRWMTEGQVTDIPAIAFGDPMGNSRFSDRWIEDGSYLRVKTIKLAYDVPVSYSWLQGLTVWCAAENVFTFTKYDGNDPENSVNNNILYQGIDAGMLPQCRSLHFGVKVNL